MGSGAVVRPWSTSEPQGATFVELFFDLVFVFAVTSITGSLVEDLTWGNVGHNAIVLWLVWWAWTQFTWTLNPADTTHRAVRLITLLATAAAFFMAQAIPEAFGSAGPWFAIAYAAVRLLGLGLQLGLRSDQADESSRAVVGWVLGSSVGLVAVLAGGFVASPWREVFWTVAALLDVVAATRAGRGLWTLHAAHFAERHGLIVIIALGESLIAAGLALGHVPRNATFALGTLAAVGAICALWWVYFGSAKDAFEAHLEASPADRVGAEARDIYSLGHLPMIAGIIAFAVAIEQALAHPDDPLALGGVWALCAGVVLYLGGIAFDLRRSGGGLAVPLLVAAGITVLGVLVLRSASGVSVLVVTAGVLIALALWDAAATDGVRRVGRRSRSP